MKRKILNRKVKKNDDEVAMVKEVIYRGRQLSESSEPLNKLNSTSDISANCSKNIILNKQKYNCEQTEIIVRKKTEILF